MKKFFSHVYLLYLSFIALSTFSAENGNREPLHDLQHVPLWAVYQIHGAIIASEFQKPTITEDELFCIAYLHCMACTKDTQRTHVKLDLQRSLSSSKPGNPVNIFLFDNQAQFNLVYYRDLYTATLQDIHTGWILDKHEPTALEIVVRKKENNKYEHSIISHLITLMNQNKYIKVGRIGKIENLDITLTIQKKNLELVLEKFNIFSNISFKN